MTVSKSESELETEMENVTRRCTAVEEIMSEAKAAADCSSSAVSVSCLFTA